MSAVLEVSGLTRIFTSQKGSRRRFVVTVK